MLLLAGLRGAKRSRVFSNHESGEIAGGELADRLVRGDNLTAAQDRNAVCNVADLLRL